MSPTGARTQLVPALNASRLSFQQQWRSGERRRFELDHVVVLRLSEEPLNLLLGMERLIVMTRLRIEKMWRMEIVVIVGLMRPIMVEM
jgi:hypothetical protein